MESSILTSTKKLINIAENYTAFDLDIITHINSVFSAINQLGVGPLLGFEIEDSSAKWEDLDLPINQLSFVKTYVFLKTRLAFDPPSTSFHIEAMEKQIREVEWRLSTFREDVLIAAAKALENGSIVIDGGDL